MKRMLLAFSFALVITQAACNADRLVSDSLSTGSELQPAAAAKLGPQPESSCQYAHGFSIVGGTHFVYWLSSRPASYDALIYIWKIHADPYGANGILVQKRDICLYCGCNPVPCIVGVHVCAK